jgi:hypothetical protein
VWAAMSSVGYGDPSLFVQHDCGASGYWGNAATTWIGPFGQISPPWMAVDLGE